VNSIIYAITGDWHDRCHYLWQESSAKQNGFKFDHSSGVHMFDGKNNRILDSFSFRLALTAAVFLAWSGAGYVLLSLA
jgi:hypothetical protein